MKINRIILIDEGDEFYQDLIEFERDTTRMEVFDTIESVKNKLKDNYTNEDIYQALDKKIGIKDITFLGNYEEFYY